MVNARENTYELDDPRPIARSAPYTYFIPTKDDLNAVNVGENVQLIFRPIPNNRKYGAERMWVDVIEIHGEKLIGELMNDPYDIPQLTRGDQIEFDRFHIISIDWKDKATAPKNENKSVREYWDRCYVDQEVLDSVARVGYIYREEPEQMTEDEKYPDSGWRIRADVSQVTDEQYENPTVAYIAIGKVLNADDSWVHLIDAPTGSHFLRNAETGEFEEAK